MAAATPPPTATAPTSIPLSSIRIDRQPSTQSSNGPDTPESPKTEKKRCCAQAGIIAYWVCEVLTDGGIAVGLYTKNVLISGVFLGAKWIIRGGVSVPLYKYPYLQDLSKVGRAVEKATKKEGQAAAQLDAAAKHQQRATEEAKQATEELDRAINGPDGVKNLQQRLANEAKRASELDAKLAVSEEKARKDLSKLDDENKQLKALINSVKGSLAKITQGNAALTTIVGREDEENRELAGHVAQFKANAAAIQQQGEQELVEVQRQLDQALNLSKGMIDQLSAQNIRQLAKLDRLEKLNQDSNATEQRLIEQARVIDAMRQEKEETTRMLDELKRENEEFRRQSQQVLASMDQAHKRVDADVQQGKAAVDDAVHRLSQVAERNAKSVNRLEALLKDSDSETEDPTKSD